MREAPSLRQRLLAWLIAPVVVLTAVSALVGYYTSYRFANQVYDRWISDTATTLAELVEVRGSTFVVALPPEAERMLGPDRRDRIYYHVMTEAGAFIAGHRGLPPPREMPVPGRPPSCEDSMFEGQAVRVASYRPIDLPVVVQVAETVTKRDVLAREILAGMLVPLIAVMALAVAGVWVGVARGLQPLTTLAAAIANRSARDLRAVDERRSPAEVRPLAHALNGLLQRLQDALAMQRRFVADAAHQLRTPVTGLKTQAELALRSSDPAETRVSLEQIVGAADRTTRLINQLLSLARAEPGAPDADRREPVDLARMMREETAAWIPRSLASNIDLGFETDGTQARILGDPTMLSELAGNLIDNALRYAGRGAHVTVGVARVGDSVELSVTDDGPGVPADERDRVFERFHRVLGTHVEGSGLGLSIAREIAHRHDAQIHLAPGPGGHGTCVSVRFPLSGSSDG
jgi:two-component system sensor histidine kinase TctE